MSWFSNALRQNVSIQVLAKASRAVDRVAALVLAWQERSADRARLAALDDRMLKDMGLTRADTAKESNKPFWIA
jgi:uncharacterized protein YjiS (DUF1127 family)